LVKKGLAMFRRETYDQEGNVVDLIERPYNFEEETAIWEGKMKASDAELMSRWEEEHIEHDHGGVTSSPGQQDKYDEKKALRLEQPKE